MQFNAASDTDAIQRLRYLNAPEPQALVCTDDEAGSYEVRDLTDRGAAIAEDGDLQTLAPLAPVSPGERLVRII
ncbi:hypothetical protein [Prosthecomicrobium hirschii]|uniref:hypothetical protein n=1 Tax=Prosthecodimorpha hirschii TaxID=665126 RepID=UPI00221FF35A|nr:hypothetical protein [Prosthecomicrobium hirschii]MCW1844153.1 hypothetical protein [Prosthecomicrobium hirschii]